MRRPAAAGVRGFGQSRGDCVPTGPNCHYEPPREGPDPAPPSHRGRPLDYYFCKKKWGNFRLAESGILRRCFRLLYCRGCYIRPPCVGHRLSLVVSRLCDQIMNFGSPWPAPRALRPLHSGLRKK